MYSPEPEIKLDAKELALKEALIDREPLCTGVCVVPEHQSSLYYRHDDNYQHIDFSKAGADDLEKLYRACKPAPFGRGGETVVDETYRKAGKMDVNLFSTPFDPRGLGMNDLITKSLLTDKYASDVEMELYKLNVYGKDDFFKSHKDTPRRPEMFGSLVVVFPTKHEGGQLVLRHGKKDWTIDFSDKIAAATQPSMHFVAFFGDIDHEVLPITSGYRVTLTYNLYRKPPHPNTTWLPTPYLEKLKRTLIDVVNDKSKLATGGYLGFGLAHEYVFSEDMPITMLLPQLKGCDRALADLCDELGLEYALKFFYCEESTPFYLLTSRKLECDGYTLDPHDANEMSWYRDALLGSKMSTDDAECVVLLQDGQKPLDPEDPEEFEGLEEYCQDPVRQVLAITPLKSSVEIGTAYPLLGNEASVEYLYGTACMMISVDPAESRAVLA